MNFDHAMCICNTCVLGLVYFVRVQIHEKFPPGFYPNGDVTVPAVYISTHETKRAGKRLLSILYPAHIVVAGYGVQAAIERYTFHASADV